MARRSLRKAHPAARCRTDQRGPHPHPRRTRRERGSRVRIFRHRRAALRRRRFASARRFCNRLWLLLCRNLLPQFFRNRRNVRRNRMNRRLCRGTAARDSPGFRRGLPAGSRHTSARLLHRRCRRRRRFSSSFRSRRCSSSRTCAPAPAARATTSRFFRVAAALAACIRRGEWSVRLIGNGRIARLRARGGIFSANGYT
jgi:hypothetical protein